MATAEALSEGPRGGAAADHDLDHLLALTEARLDQSLPRAHGGESVLIDAARSALMGRGKRVRPIMTMLACAHVGGRAEDALDFGCAVEMVHAASLALDDLPCMDDAALRRGAPTVHRAHGEDAAVLASIALLNQAHRLILQSGGLDAERRLDLVETLTHAVGFDGLTQGQMRDLRDPVEDRTEYGLRRLNHLKTAALFTAGLRGGGLIGGAGPQEIQALSLFGERIGFAFQLFDDLLDATATAEVLGKDVAQDRGKITFVDLWGEGRVRSAIGQSLAWGRDALGENCALSDYVWRLFGDAGFAA
ncbi:polyprenyl synthetase family protein [Brevundimonas sp.]|uniref:polyprenyl synthetase family protein n=1 Tax=Brevundimonas sp. TaxID=1871086 RepID=UPI003BA8B99A